MVWAVVVLVIHSSTPMRSILYSIILHAVFIFVVLLEWLVKPQNNAYEYALVMDIIPISELTNVQASSAIPRKQSASFMQENMQQKNTHRDATPHMHNAGESKVDNAKQASSARVTTSQNIERVKPTPLPVPKKTVVAKSDKKLIPPRKAQTSKMQKRQDEYSKIVLKSLNNKKSSYVTKKEVEKKELQLFDVMDDILKGEINKEYNPSLEMTFSEIDAIRMQIYEVWNTIAFSGSGSTMCVKLLLKVNKSGEVLSVRPVLEHNGNPSYQAFVDSVIRAAYQASPFKGLPVEKYKYWQDMELTFSSDQMIY